MSTKEIELTKGYVSLVDDTDFEWLSGFSWSAHECNGGLVYARGRASLSGSKRRLMLMHRLIMGDPDKKFVDHKDRNGLNNQRENLRIADRFQSMHNREKMPGVSKYKGVWFLKNDDRWVSSITNRGKREYLGCFEHEIEAAVAYNTRAKELHGEFAVLNTITREEGDNTNSGRLLVMV